MSSENDLKECCINCKALLPKVTCPICYNDFFKIILDETEFEEEVENIQVIIHDGDEKILTMKVNKDDVENIYSFNCSEEIRDAIRHKEHHANNFNCLLHAVEEDIDSKLCALFLPLQIYSFIFKSVFENEDQLFFKEDTKPLLKIGNILEDELDLVNEKLIPYFEDLNICYTVNEVELEMKPELAKLILKNIKENYTMEEDHKHCILVDDLNKIMIKIFKTLKTLYGEDIEVVLVDKLDEDFDNFVFPKDNIITDLTKSESKDEIERKLKQLSLIFSQNLTKIISKIVEKYEDKREMLYEDIFEVFTKILDKVYDRYNDLFLKSLKMDKNEEIIFEDWETKMKILENIYLYEDDLEENVKQNLKEIHTNVLRQFVKNVGVNDDGLYFNELPLFIEGKYRFLKPNLSTTFLEKYFYSRLEILLEPDNIKLANKFYNIYDDADDADVLKSTYKCMLRVFLARIVFDFETRNIQLDGKNYSLYDLLEENNLTANKVSNLIILYKLITYLLKQNNKIQDALLHLDRDIHIELKANGKIVEKQKTSEHGEFIKYNYLMKSCNNCPLY